jgi:putative methyltransferase (TIGR04325 family)
VRRVVSAVRSRIVERLHPHNTFRGVYASAAEAESAVSAIEPIGYDAAETTGWYAGKHNGIRLEDYPVVYWLRAAFADSRSVFEVGGHVGVAYYGYASVLEHPPDLRWTIMDVPSVNAAGERLARQRGRTNLEFVTDPTLAEGADVVLAAGSLQYVDRPTLPEIVTSLPVRPRHILLNNTPLYDGPDFVTIQNLGKAYCPYRVFNRTALVRSLEGLGYELVDRWVKPRRFRLRGHPERSFDHYSGMYLRARSI